MPSYGKLLLILEQRMQISCGATPEPFTPSQVSFFQSSSLLCIMPCCNRSVQAPKDKNLFYTSFALKYGRFSKT